MPRKRSTETGELPVDPDTERDRELRERRDRAYPPAPEPTEWAEQEGEGRQEVPPPSPPQPRLDELGDVLSLEEVAALVRTTPETVLKWHAAGDFPGRRIGRKFLVLKTAVVEWLAGG